MGIEEVNNPLVIYPNPTEAIVYVSFDGELEELILLNLEGKILQQHHQIAPKNKQDRQRIETETECRDRDRDRDWRLVIGDYEIQKSLISQSPNLPISTLQMD